MRSDILVPFPTYPDQPDGSIAERAVEVAVLLGRRLHALAIEVDIPDVSNALSRVLMDLPEMIRQAETRSRAAGSDLLHAFEAAAIPKGVTLDTQAITAAPAAFGDAAADAARYHDLSLAFHSGAEGTARLIAEALVFGSGRPVLLMPQTGRLAACSHVAIAWDGSRVAARAVADALPFLQMASGISILTVGDEKPLRHRDAGERLAHRLRLKGFAAVAVETALEGRSIAGALQEKAAAIGADLLVMGGYGHSRVRDFILGGATSGVLDALRLPVLISH